jgi:hypothetical protein
MNTLLFVLLASTLLSGHAASAEGFIKLAVINGRDTLVAASGKPFFAHGVNHIGQHGARDGAKSVAEACRVLGFNAYGYGTPDDLHDDMPYLESWNDLVPMSLHRVDGSFHFVDIFDPAVQTEIAAKIEKLCVKNRESKNLIGYLWTDLAAWPLENKQNQNWVQFIRALPAEAPGRKAYEQFVASGEKEDTQFLRLIAREYFKVLGTATRKHDPNHLIFGDRFIFSTIVPKVIEEMLPYVDAIAIQPNYAAGFPRAQFDRIHAMTKKPVLICDFAIRFKDGDKKINGGKLEASAEDAGKAYTDYIREAAATGYIVGAFWCNLIDSPQNSGVKQGLFFEGLKTRSGLDEPIRRLNQELPR